MAYGSKQIANVLGISQRQVNNLANDGVLPLEQKNPNKFDLSQTVQAYIQYSINKNRNVDDEKRKAAADADWKEAKAEMERIRLEEVQGDVHRSSDVEAVTNELVYSIRSMLLALPGRLAVDTCNAASPSEASEIIRQECYQILSELADHEYDPEKYKAYVREREGWSTDLLPLDDEDGDLGE